MALEQHRRRRPHALIDFSRLARLLELASDLKRLTAVMRGVAGRQ